MNDQQPSRLPRPSRRALLGGGLVVGAGVFLPACRSAAGDSTSTGSGRPRSGGTLHMVQSADILPLSLPSQNNPNFSVNRTVFNTLVSLDHTSLQPQPQLAKSWTVSADRKTYVFQLRDDVTFHTGRPFTPEDVVFVLKYYAKDTTATQMKATAMQVTSATKTGDHEVTVVFGKAVNNVWDMLEMMIILDKETIDDLATGQKIIGTGPFKVASYTPGSAISLKRNDKYWKPSRPYLDGIEISIVSQSSSAVAALRSGQAQLALDLSPLDAAGIRDHAGFRLLQSDAYDLTYYVGANVQVKPLDQPEVRLAIAWAIDRDRILKQALGGIGRTSSVPWSFGSPAWDKKQAATYSYDPAKAKRMLRSAGATGTKIDVYYSNSLATNTAVAQIVQSNLADAGLKATLQPKLAADYQKLFVSGKLPGLFVNGHGFGQLSPATLAKGAFPFNAQQNASNFSSHTYTRLADAAWTGGPGSLPGTYKQLTELLLEEQFVIDLVNSTHTYAVADKLKGVAWTMYDYLDLDNAYLA
ncbi:ABC transporter substrate-binding protein [Streptomyces sp. NPDC047028]|uniref:ABC transporter substrate-binding protein n=1 Tax=Streptomyces sp. NPDC047028 TaxID=3155793 RepID=UPI0033D3E779